MADAPMKPVEAWAVIGKDGKFLSAGNNKEILEGVWIGPDKPFRLVRVVITEKEDNHV